jgi:hypothetical protein
MDAVVWQVDSIITAYYHPDVDLQRLAWGWLAARRRGAGGLRGRRGRASSLFCPAGSPRLDAWPPRPPAQTVPYCIKRNIGPRWTHP